MVCAKQAYYELGGKAIPYNGRTQAAKLLPEIRCLVWGQLLLNDVYRWLEERLKQIGHKPPFEIPVMRFVNAILGVQQDHDEHPVYLIEEWINTPDDQFTKYINNDSSVVPGYILDEKERHRARFLSFTQHVQYNRTKGLAIVSDYQGATDLLTDPQIITAP